MLFIVLRERKSADDWNVSAQGLLWFVYTSHTFGFLFFHVPSWCFSNIDAHWQFALTFWNSSTALTRRPSSNNLLCLDADVKVWCCGIINSGKAGWKATSWTQCLVEEGHQQLPLLFCCLYPLEHSLRSPLVVSLTTAAHVSFGGSIMNCWKKHRLHWNHQLLSVMMKTSLT